MSLVSNVVQSLSRLGRVKNWPRERRIFTSHARSEIRAVPGPPIEVDCETGTLSETQFRHALERERKRAERSKSHLLLMLIDAKAFIDRHDEAAVSRRVANCVAECIRETDIAGWSRTNAVFGVLFAELGEADAEVAANAIRSKVMIHLQKSLSASRTKNIGVSFHPFPDEWERIQYWHESDQHPSLRPNPPNDRREFLLAGNSRAR